MRTGLLTYQQERKMDKMQSNHPQGVADGAMSQYLKAAWRADRLAALAEDMRESMAELDAEVIRLREEQERAYTDLVAAGVRLGRDALEKTARPSGEGSFWERFKVRMLRKGGT